MTTALIPIEEVNAIELFTKDGELEALLKRIDKEASSLVPDVETATGRKKVASNAYDVSKSKTVIENAGKELVADWKNKAKKVDGRRRYSREFLDEVRDRVRQKLTDYEAEQIKIAEEERLAAELIAAEVEAYAEHDIYLREQVIKKKEAVMAWMKSDADRIEAEKIAAEFESKRLEQVMEDARIAGEKAAEKAILIEKERAEQAEWDKIEAEEKAEREKAEAAERAEREKAEAVEQERRRAEAKAAEEKRQEAARAADRENRRKVNNKIVDAFKAESIGEKTAQKVVRLVASGGIPHMVIRY